MAESLLEDLMYEILLRLPVKALVRFRSVCKGWRDLIDSRDFAKSHPNDPPSLLIVHNLLADNKAYDVVDLSSVRSGGAPSPIAFKQLPLPGEGEVQHYVGNCNGLVCIRDGTGVLVWNPATGKQFRLGLPIEKVWIWGFGYDEDSNDYKVVALECEEEKGEYLVWIYSLRSRSWNRINDYCINYFPHGYARLGSSGVFVNGALHYPVSHAGTNVDSIGALHLGNLECKVVPTPDYSESSESWLENYFGALNGRLCVIYHISSSIYKDKFDLWMMKEYGVKESWTRLVRYSASYPYRLIPITYLEDEEVLLFNAEKNGYDFENGLFIRTYEYNELVKYEVRTRSYGRAYEYNYNELVKYEIRTRSFGRAYEFETRSSERLYGLRLYGGHWSFGSYVYVPSLVSPQSYCD